MAVPAYKYLLLLAALITASNGVGLMRLSESGDECPDFIQFKCNTTGIGRTSLTLDTSSDPFFSVSHAEYNDNIEPLRYLGDDIIVGNLSRSTDQDCFDQRNNRTDFCYTTMVVIRLTEQILCRVITCMTTEFRVGSGNIETDYGNATITRISSAPSNLRNTSQSKGSVTFAWDPGTPACSNTTYLVSIINCSGCDQSDYTNETYVTCDNLEPGQPLQCSVTVQGVLECGSLSVPLTRIFTVSTALSPEDTIKAGVNNIGAIVGGTITAVIVIVTIIILVNVIVLIRIKIRKIRKRDNQKLLTQSPVSQNGQNLVGDQRAIPIEPFGDDKPEEKASTKNPQPLVQSKDEPDTAHNGDNGIHETQLSKESETNFPQKAPTSGSSSGAEVAATGTGKPEPLKQVDPQHCDSETHATEASKKTRKEGVIQIKEGVPDSSRKEMHHVDQSSTKDHTVETPNQPPLSHSNSQTERDPEPTQTDKLSNAVPGGAEQTSEDELDTAHNGDNGMHEIQLSKESETNIELAVYQHGGTSTFAYTTQASNNSRKEMHEAEESEDSALPSSHKMVAISGPKQTNMLSQPPHSSAFRGGEPLNSGLGHPVEIFKVLKDPEINAGSNTDTENKPGPPEVKCGLGEHGKLFCEQQSLMDRKTSKAVPSSNDEDGRALTVAAGSKTFSNNAGSKQIEHFLQRLEEVENNQEKQQKELETLKTSHEEQQKELEMLKTSHKKQQEDIEESKSRIKTLMSEITRLTDGLKEKEKRIKELEEEKDADQAEKDRLELEVENERRIRQEKENEVADLQQKLKDKEEELMDKDEKLKDSEKENEILREKVEQYEKEIASRTKKDAEESFMEDKESTC